MFDAMNSNYRIIKSEIKKYVNVVFKRSIHGLIFNLFIYLLHKYFSVVFDSSTCHTRSNLQFFYILCRRQSMQFLKSP